MRIFDLFNFLFNRGEKSAPHENHSGVGYNKHHGLAAVISYSGFPAGGSSPAPTLPPSGTPASYGGFPSGSSTPTYGGFPGNTSNPTPTYGGFPSGGTASYGGFPTTTTNPSPTYSGFPAGGSNGTYGGFPVASSYSNYGLTDTKSGGAAVLDTNKSQGWADGSQLPADPATNAMSVNTNAGTDPLKIKQDDKPHSS